MRMVSPPRCWRLGYRGPISKLIRQILGAVAEFGKAMTAAKLKAQETARRQRGKCEGRKSYAEREGGRS